MCLSSVHPVEIDKGHTETLYNRELQLYSNKVPIFIESQEFLLQLCVNKRKRMNSGNYTPFPSLVNSTPSSMAELFEKLRLFFSKHWW